MVYFTILVVSLALTSLTLGQENDDVKPILRFFKCNQPGNFSHPDKCTSLVHCTVELAAYEIECPRCSSLEAGCPEGRLYYDQERDICDSSAKVKCPPRGECEPTCIQEGYCDCFDTCIADNSSTAGGLWQRGVRCDLGLYWNPDAQNDHGGSCDFWDNLNPDLQETYRLDHTCVTPGLQCYWEADPQCDNKYFYLPHDSKNINNLQHITCPAKGDKLLFWNQKTKSCGYECQHSPCNTC